ncbi:hypothetical protein ABIB57_003640 [Devosia sp. UYZn731]|uniref:hypothetical protein n=1 Tax=Devosia sp. UYZn731 TaxID=3156345 RepID=UPI003399C780
MSFQDAFDRGFAAVKQYVDKAVADAVRRVDAIEQRGVPVSVTSAIIDRDGALVLTHSDGSTKSLGVVVGKDGVDATGKDGLGFDDLTVEHDGERTMTLRFAKGDTVKEFPITMPVVIDRGVWVEAKAEGYAKGDGVTWAGSFWISQKDDNADKPDGGDGWRLSVKRGRDGKPGKDGELKAVHPVKVG